MKKNNSDSIIGKYSDSAFKAKKSGSTNSAPLMVSYEQRYKGASSLSTMVTQQKPKQTLDEKIKAKNAPEAEKTENENTYLKVPVEIGGVRYILSTDEDMTEGRVKRIAGLADIILRDTKEKTPGLTNAKTAILALIDCCDKLVAARDELSNFKTEVMYYQQLEQINRQSNKTEPTPMEKLASMKGSSEDKNE